jgi:hypothetical protein
MNINKHGISIIINRNENETDEMYADRSWWILNQDLRNKSNKEIQQLIKFANIYINKKYLNCKYSPQVETIINQLST